MPVCNMLGCNTEAFAKVMYYHFEDGMKRPFCKEIMRYCMNHAMQISQDDSSIKIQVLN